MPASQAVHEEESGTHEFVGFFGGRPARLERLSVALGIVVESGASRPIAVGNRS
ncbi:hypothetical protein ACH47B_31270 [Rhodococcus sp. NPDC019627]|uniref:hypothetical protein n=1 Tax=unclassified Rhodococcus (in: high G+C Gram-positive bacteria) TaxID=192944 RepID=UPI0037AF14B5